MPPKPCEGLACFVANCPPGTETVVSGTVTAPNGTDPIREALVYIPTGGMPDEFPPQVSCEQCNSPFGGKPLALHFVQRNRLTLDQPKLVQPGLLGGDGGIEIVADAELLVDLRANLGETRADPAGGLGNLLADLLGLDRSDSRDGLLDFGGGNLLFLRRDRRGRLLLGGGGHGDPWYWN